MSKIKSFLALLLLLITGSIQAADNISVASVTLTPGEVSDVIINCEFESENITLYQLDLYLPEGVTLAKNAKGRYAAGTTYVLSDRHDEHGVSIAEREGFYRFVVSNNSLYTIAPGSGELLRLKVLADNSVSGTLSASIKKFSMFETDETEHPMNDVTFEMKAPEPVTDNFSVEPVTLTPGEVSDIIIDCEFTSENITLYQLDLYLPDGVTLAKNAKGRYAAGATYVLSDRHDEHGVSIAEREGFYRFVVSNNSLYTIAPGSGELLRLKVLADNTVSGTLNGSIKKFSMFETDETEHAMADVNFDLAVAEVQVLATSVALNKTETTLEVAAQEQLTATVLPEEATNKAVTWATSDPTVATVDENGLVTAVATGVATITATTTDGTDLEASCAVTVVPQPIYIETDVTSQFPTDYQGWSGATGYTPTQFAPAVTTNDGRTVQVCEKYNGSVAAEGVVFNRTLSGLTNGTYRIELYGAAASTKGRDTGIDSDMTEADDGDMTAVYLYATTASGTVKQYIPVRWATSFSEVATAVLNNVVVTEGTVEIGMYSDKKFTNWEVIQIKGVTALVDAEDLHANTLIRAQSALDDAAYVNVTGEERTALTQAIADNTTVTEQTAEAYQTAIKALDGATKTFTDAKAAYDGLVSSKTMVEAYSYPYATEAKKSAAESAAAAVATSAADATSKTEALLTAYRQYAESSALMEGIEGAVDVTDTYIRNPKAEEAIDANVWQTVLGEGSGGSIGILGNEPWTDGSGSTSHKYFDGGNWGASAWDVTFKQDITLPAGHYQLTAIGRSSQDVALTLIAGETTADMAHIGAAGGLFNRGWEQTSVEFELLKEATVSIGVQGVTKLIHNWMSFSDFRLVQSKAYAASIALNKTETTIEAGAQEQLTATVLPETAVQAVAWATSDPAVATVDENGLVTAVAPGAATITATTTDGTKLEAGCAVTVIQLATSIALNKPEATIEVGAQEQLTATVLPETAVQAVAWATSDPTVATVDENGLVTAVSEGTATITATTTDGTDLEASCAVTVAPEEIYIETDVTSQFPSDFQGWSGATGYTPTQFAPAVTTNDGRNVQVCEKYNGSVAAEGVVFSRVLTGLTNGTYRIELYGAAASTKGRDTGIDSDMTEADDGDMTAVYLYAKTAGATTSQARVSSDAGNLPPVTADAVVKQYIPVRWATSFSEVATAVLNNVVVTDGTVEIGMYSEKKYTNWEVIQIKGVTAMVDAEEMHANTLTRAQSALDDEAYVNVTGEERTALTQAIADNTTVSESTAEAYQTAIKALDGATKTFTDAKAAYDGLVSSKTMVEAYSYPYATEAKKSAAESAAAAVATSAADATSKTEALLTAYRQYAESSALMEGIEGAVDVTATYIRNPKAEEAIDANVWQTVLGEGSGGSIGILGNEPWTDGSGSTSHKYFDGGNWGASAWDVTFKQDITLPAGRYQLTAIGRSSQDVALTLIGGEATADMAHIGAAGGLFNRGWEQTSLEFELMQEATVSIGVRGVTSLIHNWMSFSDFRLAQFPSSMTAIGEVKTEAESEAAEDAPIYDLMGRRLQKKPVSGYYVQGGKTYFVK